MLYTKAINEITWSDIENFCNQRITEGLHLDYKRDFPNNLEKTISAMANTFGGIILIGVKEDEQSKPVVPIAGIDFIRGLEERVWNIILTNITPIVQPEITVALNQDNTKAIVLIRINQSHQAPHAISNNEMVYLRTGNVTTLEKRANLGELEWLQNQRRRSVSLRKQIIESANERFKYFFEKKTDETNIVGQVSFSICPIFPKEMLRTPSDLNRIYSDIRVRNFKYVLPLPDRSRGIIVQNGSILSEVNGLNNSHHNEINSFGLYFYTETNLNTFTDHDQEGSEIIYLKENDILARTDQFLTSADKFYDLLRYRGGLIFNASLMEIQQVGFVEYWGNRGQVRFTPDKQMIFTIEISRPPISEKKEEILFQLGQKIRWTFGSEIDLQEFLGIMQSIRS